MREEFKRLANNVEEVVSPSPVEESSFKKNHRTRHRAKKRAKERKCQTQLYFVVLLLTDLFSAFVHGQR